MERAGSLSVRSSWRQGRCAYCRVAFLRSGAREEDHVQPRSRESGLPGEGETVPACPRCNRLKGSRTAATDPETGHTVRLFDPRCMVWEQHFAIPRPSLIVGLTPTGRATAGLLFRPTPSYPQDPGPWPFRAMSDDDDAHYLTAQAIHAYRQNRFADLGARLGEVWEAAEESTSATRDYLVRIGVWLEGSVAAKRARPHEQRDAGLRHLHRVRGSIDQEFQRRVWECLASSLDHRRHALPQGNDRDRMTRTAAGAFSQLARSFPGEATVSHLRATALYAQAGDPVRLTRYERDVMREAALVEARACNFSAAAMLLDVLARVPNALDEHRSLAAEVDALAPISGVGQGLDLVEESVLRRAVTVARLVHDPPSDLGPLQALLDWTMAHEMWNEAAEVVLAGHDLARRGRAESGRARALESRLTKAVHAGSSGPSGGGSAP